MNPILCLRLQSDDSDVSFEFFTPVDNGLTPIIRTTAQVTLCHIASCAEIWGQAIWSTYMQPHCKRPHLVGVE
jgi:hypothetical protein